MSKVKRENLLAIVEQHFESIRNTIAQISVRDEELREENESLRALLKQHGLASYIIRYDGNPERLSAVGKDELNRLFFQTHTSDLDPECRRYMTAYGKRFGACGEIMLAAVAEYLMAVKERNVEEARRREEREQHADAGV
jgi:hypothetical protein